MDLHDGKTYDVIVAGAGSAGFCAAVQAGRAGLKVALFEKYGMPGGTLTVLGNNSIDQFNNPHRPVGDRMVIAGIGWEFASALAKRGYATIPDMDAPYQAHWQYGVRVNPVAAAQCMDDFLLEAGVDLYYNQGVAAVETSAETGGKRIGAVLVSTKKGLVRHPASMFIDCTGDGDLCAWAGAPFVCAEELQPGTMRLYVDGAGAEAEALARANGLWETMLNSGAASREDFFGKDLNRLFASRGDNVNHVCGFNAADSDSKTRAEIDARRSALRLMEALRQSGLPQNIVACAPEVAARESRRILGDTVMTGEEYLEKRLYPDAVCYTYWFVDIHRAHQPAEIIYLKDEKTPTISLGAMRPQGLTNVYVAGRCVSSDRANNSAIRVKASCMAMGQACGAAAAVAIRRSDPNTRNTPLEAVRAYLTGQGAIVPPVVTAS